MTDPGVKQPTLPSHGKIPATLVALLPMAYLVATSAANLTDQFSAYDFKRLLQAFLFVSLFALSLVDGQLRRSVANRVGAAPGWLRWGLTGFFLLGFVSVIQHPNPGYGLADVGLFALIATSIPVVAASRVVLGRRFDTIVIASIALLGLAVAIQEFAGVLANWAMGKEFRYQEMLINFAHPRFYNQLQTWSLPALAALPFLAGGSRRAWAATALLLGLQWAIVLMSGARGSFVSILSALGVIALLMPGLVKRWLPVHATGLLLGAVLFTLITLGNQQWSPTGGEFLEESVQRPMMHTSGRTVIWQAAWRESEEHPWLGVGPSRYGCGLSDWYPAHPHSLPVQILAEWGWVATLLLAALFGAGMLQLAIFLRKSTVPLGNEGLPVALLFGCVIAAALHANLSGILVMPASQVLSVVMAGWLLGALPVPRSAGHRVSHGLLLPLAGLAIGLALCWFAASEIGQLGHRTVNDNRALPIHPRFWLVGQSCQYTYP